MLNSGANKGENMKLILKAFLEQPAAPVNSNVNMIPQKPDVIGDSRKKPVF